MSPSGPRSPREGHLHPVLQARLRRAWQAEAQRRRGPRGPLLQVRQARVQQRPLSGAAADEPGGL
eukprot:6709659-Prymnesium_polylepis.1